MTKLELEAIRVLPEEYVVDGTRIAQWEKDTVVAANQNLHPLIYEKGKWRKIESDDRW